VNWNSKGNCLTIEWRAKMSNTAYKQTEVGVIPSDWEVKNLDEIATIIGGGTPSTNESSFWNGAINWFTPTEIGLNKYSFESVRKITKSGLENSSARVLPIGTILLTTRAGIGDESILMNEACTNQGFQSFVSNENFNNEYIYYLISTLKNTFLQNASGSTFLEISPKKIKAIKVAVPTLTEQNLIATALSDADALISSLEKLIAKKRMIKQGAMQKLLEQKEGWKAELSIIKQTKSATVWDCDLIPKTLVIDRYFLTEKKAIEKLDADKETIATQITELEEEHGSAGSPQVAEEGYFADLDKVNKANVQKRLKELLATKPKAKNQDLSIAAESETAYGEQAVLELYLKLLDDQTELNKKIKEAIAYLDIKVIERYKTLTETEIKQLVVDDKWMASIERSVKTEMERISQRLTQRIKELAERYETPLPKLTTDVAELENKVTAHLQKMGFQVTIH
jgi:hypothetical protein